MLARGTPWFILVPPALALALVAAIIVTAVPSTWWSWALVAVLAVASAFFAAFFRDPERRVGEGLLAPAHGRVLAVDEDVVEADGAWTRVSTFMGPLDVHVVRAPLGGTVRGMERAGASFARADAPGAGHNVRLTMELEGEGGRHRVVLVSGWFARRIVPYVAVGDAVARGARIGLIRFGSRVDVLVPKGEYTVSVARGARVRAGETSLGVRADARR